MDKNDDNSDQSMEEILQSIKRIIADDEVENDNAEAKPKQVAVQDEVKGSDVLELKDIVDSPNDTSQPEHTDEGNALSALLDNDEGSKLAESEIAQQPIASDTKEDTSDNHDVLAGIDSLLTEETATASAGALQQLKQASKEDIPPLPADDAGISFRSGTTLETLVVEALKPELKAWLNANLPAIVERLVKAEIEKIAK